MSCYCKLGSMYRLLVNSSQGAVLCNLILQGQLGDKKIRCMNTHESMMNMYCIGPKYNNKVMYIHNVGFPSLLLDMCSGEVKLYFDKLLNMYNKVSFSPVIITQARFICNAMNQEALLSMGEDIVKYSAIIEEGMSAGIICDMEQQDEEKQEYKINRFGYGK